MVDDIEEKPMTQAEVLRQLKKKEGIVFSKQYLGRIVKEGKIPYTETNGKKDFEYETVVQALKDMKQKLPDGGKYNPKNKDGSAKTINDTKIFLQEYQGKLAQQKFDVEAGKLVYRDEVEQKAFTVMRVLRDQLLAIPERITADIMASKDIREGKEVFFKELNEVLEYISDEKVLYE